MRVLDTLEPDPRYVGLEFSELNRQSIRAHRSGDFETMVSIGQWMLQVAKAPREKVFAYNRWSGGLNGLGQYVQAMDVIKTALRETDLPPSERGVMQINLANGHFTLCNLIEARTIATELISELQEVPAEEHTFTTRARLAFLYYVRGHTLRRMMDGSHDSVRRYAEAAMSDLLVAEKRHTDLAEETKDPYLRALATVSAGGQLELKALLESSDAGTECIEAMPGYHTLTEALLSKGDIGLECQGWLSIFATNIARRHLEGTERANALTKHARRILKVANRLDNWTFRAAAYEALHLSDPNRAPWLENPAELQLMIETMGRLPVFRETGWRILSDTGALERAAQIDPRTWRKGLRCA